MLVNKEGLRWVNESSLHKIQSSAEESKTIERNMRPRQDYGFMRDAGIGLENGTHLLCRNGPEP